MTNSFSSISEIVDFWAEKSGEKTALVFVLPNGNTQEVSFAQLREDSINQASLLKSEGLNPQDFVILAFDHGYSLLKSFLGSIYAGIIPSIFPYVSDFYDSGIYSTRLPAVVESLHPKAILTEKKFVEKLANILGLKDCKVFSTVNKSVLNNYSTPLSISPLRTAFIQFTSGTTYSPKGIEISHEAAILNVGYIAEIVGFKEDWANVGWLPLYHDYGLFSQILLPLIMGGLSVLISPRTWLRHPSLLFKLIEKYGAETTFMPNFGFHYMVRSLSSKELEGCNLNSLRMIGNAGEKADFDSIIHFIEGFQYLGLRKETIKVFYGMAENSAIISATPSDQQIIMKSGIQNGKIISKPVVSCGKPASPIEIEIRGDNCEILQEMYIGKIFIKSPSLFSGYRNRSDLTNAVMKNGWLETGDLGFLSEGQLFVCGRDKDLIIIAGEKIFPEIVEEICFKVVPKEKIKRIAAFGIPDQKIGTEKCILTIEPSHSFNSQEERSFSTGIVSEIQREFGFTPGDVCFVKKGLICVTTSGKIMRSATRENYLLQDFWPNLSTINPEIALSLDKSTSETLQELQLFFNPYLAIPISKDENIFLAVTDSLLLLRLINKLEGACNITIPFDKWLKNPTLEYLAKLIKNPEQVKFDQCVCGYQVKQANKPFLKKLVLSLFQFPKTVFRAFADGPIFRNNPLSYKLGVRIQRLVFSIFPLWKIYFGRRLFFLHQLIEMTEKTKHRKKRFLTALMINTWVKWRIHALHNPKTFRKYVKIVISEKLENIIRSNKPLVFALQQSNGRYIISKTPQFAIRKPLPVVCGAGYDELSKRVSRFKFLYDGLNHLKSGGAVLLVADAIPGNQKGIAVTVPSGTKIFKPGSAELAVRSNGLLIPVLTNMDDWGRFTIEFLDPIESKSASEDLQIAEMTERLGKKFASRFESDFQNRMFYILETYFENTNSNSAEKLWKKFSGG
ncbi:MAG: AMP-binding protein [Candidatus Riflebacteria bacterium]|nr:AMP-binding protein [Candidatus Riflebacteria bacterium]